MLAIARGYHNTFDRGGVPQAPPAPPPVQPTGLQITDDTIVTGKELRSILEQAQRSYIDPQNARLVEMASSSVYGTARQLYPKEFAKYGPEIQQELAKVPRNLWTLDNLDTIVTLVAGRHREDYARERAQELIANMEPTIRPSGGGAGSSSPAPDKTASLESDAIPSDWKDRAKRAGITEATVREFCATNDMTPEAFFKMFEKSPLQPIVAEVPRGTA